MSFCSSGSVVVIIILKLLQVNVFFLHPLDELFCMLMQVGRIFCLHLGQNQEKKEFYRLDSRSKEAWLM